jgi:hypothetical protein
MLIRWYELTKDTIVDEEIPDAETRMELGWNWNWVKGNLICQK